MIPLPPTSLTVILYLMLTGSCPVVLRPKLVEKAETSKHTINEIMILICYKFNIAPKYKALGIFNVKTGPI